MTDKELIAAYHAAKAEQERLEESLRSPAELLAAHAALAREIEEACLRLLPSYRTYRAMQNEVRELGERVREASPDARPDAERARAQATFRWMDAIKLVSDELADLGLDLGSTRAEILAALVKRG